ncbi:uncharacterized protein LOC126901555 isoform X7 [Daktulosphaira vitifoliae]|uniref:uncharacterized protein LOC126901555 isoform X6 n=1 Tax=Daktulosphaira vitifoliae TaxID=58002 RepID=UPI0021AAB429|nr:uncharacterized protein LOC126901555 isoform X6 [Daktulosphaira vitifoliae]XP_050534042.1 uncharacterized protein LOC126901555 isoform X7 [Daktulosphaira vitifoliae]
MFKKNVVVLLFVIFLSTELTGVLSKIDKATKFGKKIINGAKSLLGVSNSGCCPSGEEIITGSPTKLLEKLSEEFAKLGECKHCHRTPKIESVEYLTTSKNPKLGLTEEECGNMVEYLCEYYYS